MPACRQNTLLRTSCAVALVVTALIGMGAAPARAGGLDDAFAAADWKRGKTDNGITIDCVSESCGPPAHVAYILGPANAAMTNKIKSGAINRQWAERLATSFRRSQGDQITVLNFAVQTGEMPGWSMVYECNCDGTTNYVSSRIVAGGKNTMTFYSFARTPEAAQGNMNKMIIGVLGMASR
jgi:hypothetical protein